MTNSDQEYFKGFVTPPAEGAHGSERGRGDEGLPGPPGEAVPLGEGAVGEVRGTCCPPGEPGEPGPPGVLASPIAAAVPRYPLVAAPIKPADLIKKNAQGALTRPLYTFRGGPLRSPKGGGRNKPCGCGSKKKFKHCCGAPAKPHEEVQRKPRSPQDAAMDTRRQAGEAGLASQTVLLPPKEGSQ